MCDSAVILRLYSCVLQEHKIKYKVTEADIRTAIQNMKEVYKPNPGSLSDTTVYVANYNDAGHRCAYLHKYAPFHTALVADMLQKAIQENWKLFKDLIHLSERINICSLGGGPGTDIFGVLSILNATFGNFQVSATVIDCMEKWKDMFYDLLIQLRYGNFGALGKCVGEQYFEWKYLQHNLLSKMTNQVNQAIARANLVTMIKFVSASSCKDTPAMIREILKYMKPGALVLYIDNAGGGFHKLVAKEAEKCNFQTVFFKNHKHFKKSALNVKKFGYAPCFESKVSVHIWRKAFVKTISSSRLGVSTPIQPISHHIGYRRMGTILYPSSSYSESNSFHQTFSNNTEYGHIRTLRYPTSQRINSHQSIGNHTDYRYSNIRQNLSTSYSRPNNSLGDIITLFIVCLLVYYFFEFFVRSKT